MTETLTTPVVELPKSSKIHGVKAVTRTVAAFAAGMAVMSVALKILDRFESNDQETETSN